MNVHKRKPVVEGQEKVWSMAKRLKIKLAWGVGFAEPNPYPIFPNPPGLLRLEPHSEGLRERIWWRAASNATAVWAVENGMIEQDKRAIFERSYAAEPDQLIKELAEDEAIQEADTLLLTIPNTLGADYNIKESYIGGQYLRQILLIPFS